MIDFETIQKAKCGDEKAINTILNYYMKKIKYFSDDDEFVQKALISVFFGIGKFKFIKK